ncbi:hypothetical protein [Rhodoblastus sp.]|jgi:hypothetical protein|uniref:hypothetical protein n=1 Tax=Rhodoblastus sp. TaxID=1962975 RepID=UPI0025DA3631|nr:hypothetical protein [Rhodoblastus sp.]
MKIVDATDGKILPTTIENFTTGEIRDAYNRSIEALDRVVPEPTIGESTLSYARRAANAAKRALPRADPLSRLDFAEVPDSALRTLSNELLRNISTAVLDPETTAPGELRMVPIRNTENNLVERRFIGRDSFVKGLGLPSRRVTAINAPARENLMAAYGMSGGRGR